MIVKFCVKCTTPQPKKVFQNLKIVIASIVCKPDAKVIV